MGLEDGQIKDNQIRRSTANHISMSNARLNNKYAFVSGVASQPFVQVDLGPARKQVTAVAVQGRDRGRVPWTFYVKHMRDLPQWSNYAENGVVRVRYFLKTKKKTI